jgi:adenosine/AMP kinase
MYEAVVNTVPQAKFGLAFNESSGPCLTRAEGNDDELQFRRCGSRILLFLAFVIYL